MNNQKEVIELKSAYYAVQNLASIFDSTLERIPRYAYTVEGDQSLSVFGYQNKATKKQVATIWIDSEIPSNDHTKTKMDWGFLEGEFEEPVYVDLRTGNVYEIPDSQWRNKGRVYQFDNIPVYDSPVLIIDNRNVLITQNDDE